MVGGINALTPQNLKVLVGLTAGEAANLLLKELTTLINVMLSGDVEDAICVILYGVNLYALRKRDGIFSAV